jgi:Zn-finger nucleic acid-binding protein
MKCPKCGMGLIEIDYKDIKVDKCSGCEGVWLDAGELETVSQLEKTGLDKLFSVFKKRNLVPHESGPLFLYQESDLPSQEEDGRRIVNPKKEDGQSA